jgi:hypothetical protein
MVVVPAVGALVAAWAVPAILYALGVSRHRPVWTGAGVFLAGILLFVTAAILELTTLPTGPRGYDISLGEILVIGLSGFLGGSLAMLGGSYITLAARLVRTPPQNA